MPYLSNKTRTFLNRVKVKEMLKPNDFDESAVFLLKDRSHQFSIDIETVLSCLNLAEAHGVVPPLSRHWWQQVKKRGRTD